jgi:hypothetical protein
MRAANNKARMATLREHIQAESAHDMEGVLHGFTGKCFNDIACVPKPFVGRKKVAERYRKHCLRSMINAS